MTTEQETTNERVAKNHGMVVLQAELMTMVMDFLILADGGQLEYFGRLPSKAGAETVAKMAHEGFKVPPDRWSKHMTYFTFAGLTHPTDKALGAAQDFIDKNPGKLPPLTQDRPIGEHNRFEDN